MLSVCCAAHFCFYQMVPKTNIMKWIRYVGLSSYHTEHFFSLSFQLKQIFPLGLKNSHVMHHVKSNGITFLYHMLLLLCFYFIYKIFCIVIPSITILFLTFITPYLINRNGITICFRIVFSFRSIIDVSVWNSGEEKKSK